MKKSALAVLALLLVLILAAGCATRKEPSSADDGTSDAGSDKLTAEIEDELAELDMLEEDVNLTELDSIDDELADIDTMFE